MHVATYLNVDFSSSAQVKIQVKFNFKLFWKKSNFWFTCCSTRENLSVDVSINNLRLISTKPGRFLFSAYGKSGYGQNSISNFFEKNLIWEFPCCSTRGLILTKLRWFVKSQNSNFELFLKKKSNFGFPWCSTRENLSIDVSITNVGLILTNLRWFQLFVKIRISNFFEKNIKFLDFNGVVLVKTFPLMYQLLM